MRFGVLRFPGSCDEVDALYAARRVGDAELLWHGERDLKGADAIVVPGGFSYGDYLRAGAIARFSPVMESVIAFAADGGLVLGICNGFQVLCEAHLLPGCAVAEREPALHLPAGGLDVARGGDSVHGGVPAPGRGLPEHPGQALVGSLLRGRANARGDPATTARSCCAMRPARTSTAPSTTSRACATSAGNVFGLMPHPEHAVDELTRVDRWARASSRRCGWRSRARVVVRPARRCQRVEDALGARADTRRVRPDLREAGARAKPGRAGDVLAAVERALRLQALQEAAAHAADGRARAW